jgi:hypothetical protein
MRTPAVAFPSYFPIPEAQSWVNSLNAGILEAPKK